MSYSGEWFITPIVLGALLLPVIAPPFALIAVVLVALAVLAALVALAAAVLASPYLLVRFLRRRHAERYPSAEASEPVARVIAHPGRATATT